MELKKLLVFLLGVGLLSGCASQNWAKKDNTLAGPAEKESASSVSTEEITIQGTEEKDEKEAEPVEKCEVPIWKVGDFWRYRDDEKKRMAK